MSKENKEFDEWFFGKYPDFEYSTQAYQEVWEAAWKRAMEIMEDKRESFD